jgi:hypothetical protein
MRPEVNMSKSTKPAKPSRRPVDAATRDIDQLFARSRALAPSIIEHSGVFNASSDEWFDALTALGTPVEDRFHALYDKHDTEVTHAIMGLIRFRGHVPKGGYDVPNGQSGWWPAPSPAVHG